MEKIKPNCSELFYAFQQISLSSFGGALPWTRIILVERKQWLNEDEYAELISFCQFVPGPNILNASIVVGQKFQGGKGSLSALAGLITIPFIITMLAGFFYTHFHHNPHLKGMFDGIGAVAAGLMIVTAIQMAMHLIKTSPYFISFSFIAFALIALFSFHSFFVLLGLIPLASFISLKVHR